MKLRRLLVQLGWGTGGRDSVQELAEKVEVFSRDTGHCKDWGDAAPECMGGKEYIQQWNKGLHITDIEMKA